MKTLLKQFPVKAIIGVLTAEPSMLSTVYQELSEHFGPIDYTSELLTFDSTDYYESEMGIDLKRTVYQF